MAYKNFRLGFSRVMVTQSTTAATGSFTLYYAAPVNRLTTKQHTVISNWVIFYELTTGVLPFKGDTVTDTIIAIASPRIRPLRVYTDSGCQRT